MAIARRSGSHAEIQYTTSAAARTLAYGQALQSGSLLVCTVSALAGVASPTVTVSDGTNGAYTLAGAYANKLNAAVSQWFLPNNASTGTPTVTVTPSSGSYLSITLDEFTGAATSGVLRSTATNNGSSATITTGTVTAVSGDLVMASAGQQTGGALANTVGAPFTLVTNLGAAVNEGIYTAFDVNASGSEGCTFNMASSVAWSAVGASYLAAGAVPSPSTPLPNPSASVTPVVTSGGYIPVLFPSFVYKVGEPGRLILSKSEFVALGRGWSYIPGGSLDGP